MDVSTAISKARAVFNKFGVAVDDQSDTLDYFFRISQNSGVEMDQLLSILESSDRGFQLLGLSAEESAVMVGTAISKDGVETVQELAAGLEMAAGCADSGLDRYELMYDGQQDQSVEARAGSAEVVLQVLPNSGHEFGNIWSGGDYFIGDTIVIACGKAGDVYGDCRECGVSSLGNGGGGANNGRIPTVNRRDGARAGSV